jgi:hypothetical protein
MRLLTVTPTLPIGLRKKDVTGFFGWDLKFQR